MRFVAFRVELPSRRRILQHLGCERQPPEHPSRPLAATELAYATGALDARNRRVADGGAACGTAHSDGTAGRPAQSGPPGTRPARRAAACSGSKGASKRLSSRWRERK